MEKATIYTVGHSNHRLEVFLNLIEEYSVNCIIDVRTIAASSYNPQYNKSTLSNFLKKRNIIYMHFSKEFGARHTEVQLLDEEGKVDFELVRKSSDFRNGVNRLWDGVKKNYTMALMCSESEPFDCHRFSMISKALECDGFNVMHILKDKTLKSNSELENLLLKKYEKKISKPDFFNPYISLEDQLSEAYRLKNKEIAFSPYSKQTQEEDKI